MNKSDFYYELPQELIAQTPPADRASSRLLVFDRDTGCIWHRYFRDILEYLRPNDCLILNNTKVIPARLHGVKETTGALIEIMLLRQIGPARWEALARPGKRLKPGDRVIIGDGKLIAAAENAPDITDDGVRIIRFEYNGIFEEILDELGETPLPPYITEKLADKSRYQTVYAKCEGSVAAPTAGLHFTKDILSQAAVMGVYIAEITLHVGLGTFRPVKCDNILEHRMHSEYYEVTAAQAGIITNAKKNGGRIICVGTTSCRTVESLADESGAVGPGAGHTDIFIYPGYRFKMTDALVTNFHLPESTLLMLVSAFAGRENMLRAYDEAIRNKYRFFSFGDCMLIL